MPHEQPGPREHLPQLLLKDLVVHEDRPADQPLVGAHQLIDRLMTHHHFPLEDALIGRLRSFRRGRRCTQTCFRVVDVRARMLPR
ncbi:hypothetical protein D3C87_1380280 [compost metagenome]